LTALVDICAFTSICEEDKVWIPQYLAEVDRLQMPFVIHFDRCSRATKIRLTEQHKQNAFDIAVSLGFKWAMAWDCDETYERDAVAKIQQICALDADYVDIIWHNLWDNPAYIRTDGPFSSGHRVKFYNLRKRWRFTHSITNGPKIVNEKGTPISGNPQSERATRFPLVCLHWGMLTRELRLQHKARWDRIYTAAVGNNPYGFWEYSCDEKTYPPVLEKHDYF
jgi:hypothetical protein